MTKEDRIKAAEQRICELRLLINTWRTNSINSAPVFFVGEEDRKLKTEAWKRYEEGNAKYAYRK